MSASELKLDDVITSVAEQIWGFTGTRAGMSNAQYGWSRRIMRQGRPSTFHHGGAFGADTQVHAIWSSVHSKGHVTVWPADTRRAQMFTGQARVTVEEIMDPLVRNGVIVSKSQFMFAAPHTNHEVLRSGTWSTIRRAIIAQVPTLILWPNGKLTLHRDKTLYRVL